MAGGDASRLGIPLPKGMFDPKIDGVKSIFELITLKIKKMNELCIQAYPEYPDLGRDRIILVIMTNQENLDKISNFFKENDYFGYKTIIFFPQSHLPVIDQQGKILLRSRDKILFAPNGNGAMFQSINGTSTFTKLFEQGIEYLHVTGVDNILNKWADPKMLGMFKQQEVDVVCKYGPKKHALERVGVYSYVSGMPYVIEYSIIGDELAKKTNTHGELYYNHSNLLIFMLKMSFLKDKIFNQENLNALNTKYNVAIKDTQNFDVKTQEIYSNKAAKFEVFIQECFTFCDPSRFLLIECNRDFVIID